MAIFCELNIADFLGLCVVSLKCYLEYNYLTQAVLNYCTDHTLIKWGSPSTPPHSRAMLSAFHLKVVFLMKKIRYWYILGQRKVLFLLRFSAVFWDIFEQFLSKISRFVLILLPSGRHQRKVSFLNETLSDVITPRGVISFITRLIGPSLMRRLGSGQYLRGVESKYPCGTSTLGKGT